MHKITRIVWDGFGPALLYVDQLEWRHLRPDFFMATEEFMEEQKPIVGDEICYDLEADDYFLLHMMDKK